MFGFFFAALYFFIHNICHFNNSSYTRDGDNKKYFNPLSLVGTYLHVLCTRPKEMFDSM